jgi:hypothetical protein
MLMSGVPGSVSGLRIADLAQKQAAPLATRRQARGALACKLICEHFLLPIFMAENVRAKLTVSSLVRAGDLFAAEDSVAEKLVNRARHYRSIGAGRHRRAATGAVVRPEPFSVKANATWHPNLPTVGRFQRRAAAGAVGHRRLLGGSCKEGICVFCLWLAWRRPTLPGLEAQYHRR